MSSVAQIVQKIIDDLSDGISQLVLLVVVLQEQNANVPPQLPQASAVVIKTAQTLVKIARNLADNNYKAFPDIQNEIHEASNAVDQAADIMTQSIQHLQATSDRKGGWAGLVDSCRVMSGKTIRLLQIVYGAEMKRLFATAEQLLDGFDGLDPGQAASDPQGFADKASDLASKANNLAKYVEDRAKEEDAPGPKAKMMDQAQKLKQGAQGLINDVNDLLAEPDNVAKKNKFKDRVDGLKDLIANAKKTVEENRTDMPEPEIVRAPPSTSAAPFNQDLEKMKKIVDKVDAGARTGNPHQVKDASDELPPAAKNLLKSARDVVETIPDPSRKKRGMDAIDDLAQIVPKEKDSIDKFVKQPTSKPVKDNLTEDTQDTRDILDDLARAVRNEDLDPIEAIDRMVRNLDKLDNAARNENPQRLQDGAKTLPRRGDDVVKACRDAAKKEKNPTAKKAIEDAVSRLEDQIPNEKKSVNDLIAKPKDDGVKQKFFEDNEDTKDILDDLRNALLGDPLAAIDKLLKDMDKVEQAAKRGDPTKLKKVTDKDVPPHARDCIHLCRDAGNKMPNPQQKKRVLDGVSDLEKEIPRVRQGSDNLAKQPASQPNKEKLLGDTADTKKTLEALKRALLGLDPDSTPDMVSPLAEPSKGAKRSVQAVQDTAKKGDKPYLPKAVDTAARDLDDLKNRAKDTADKISDPVRKQQIFDTLSDLDNAFPKQVAKARDVVQDVKNPKKVKELQDATDAVKDLIDELLDETTPPALADNAKQAQQKLDDLVNAKQKGNEPEVQKLRDEIDDLVGRVGDQAKHIAAASDSPLLAKNVLDAVRDLDDVVGTFNKGVTAKAAPAKIKEDAGRVKGALKDIVEKTAADPLAAIDRLIKTLGKVENASKAEDQPKLKKNGEKTGHQGKEVSQLTKDAAKKCPDPAQRDRIIKALDDVDNQIPHELAAIKKNLDNTSSPEAKKTVKDETDHTKDLLNKLKDALMGKEPSNKAAGDVMDAVKDLNNIAPKLNDLIKHMKDAPNDPTNAKNLTQIVRDLENPFQQLQDAILEPEDEIPLAAENLKNAVNRLADRAERGDGKGAVGATKDMMDAKKDLVDKINNYANAVQDPVQKKDLQEAAKEIEKSFPPVVRAVKDVLENPKNPEKKQKMREAARALKTAADRAADAAVPKNDEKIMRDAEIRAQDAIGRIRAAAQKGDKPGMQKGFQDLKKAGDDFQNAYRRRRGPIKFLPKDGEEDPMAELKNLWNKFGLNKDKLLADPKKNFNDFDGWGNQLKKAQGKAIDQVGARKIAPIQDVEDALDRVENGVRRGDPQAVTQGAKDLVAKANDLNKLIADEPDPKTKAALASALAPVKDLVADVINRVKESLQDPNNPEKKQRVKEAADKLRLPLNQAKNAVAPSAARRVAEKIAKAKADAAEVKQANRGNEPNKVKDALAKLSDSANQVANQLRKEAKDAKSLPDYKKQQFEDAAKRIEKLAETAKKTDPTNKFAVDEVADDIVEAVEEIQKEVESDEKDDLIRAKAKAKSIMASLKATADDMDPRSLLDCAGDLSNYLNSMMNMSMDWAKQQEDNGPLTDKARAALDLDELLRQIEGTPVDNKPVNTESLDALLASLHDLDKPASGKPVAQSASANSFEDVVSEVAREVTRSVEKYKGTQESKAIADSLHQLGLAAKNGKRQEMIMAGRTIAAHITQFITQLKTLADRVGGKNPMYQDKLIRYTHALRNFATQMKILITVKASSIEKHSDADETLVSLTRALGAQMTEALTTMDIVKVTILKE